MARAVRQRLRYSLLLAAAIGCDDPPPKPSVASTSSSAAPAASTPAEPAKATKVELAAKAMGTRLVFVAYTNDRLDEKATRAALDAAHREILRVEKLMSSWTDDSDVAAINQAAGRFVSVSPETFEVVKRSLWAGRVSDGTFDITFNSMGDLWKFGGAQEKDPKPPDPKLVAERKKLVDYKKIVIDEDKLRVKIAPGTKIGLGGIAKGYAIDRAAMKLRRTGVKDFLAQAGGDLLGSGKKPGGKPWVSGIQDPRGKQGEFFATIELEDRAFSTAGDYARSYLHEGRRYHHIIDPRTGYPADACRSVTVWASDAFTADAVDDAVFILGPEKGLALVESMEGVGAVIVDAANEVHVSERLKGKVKILRKPTAGP